MQLMVNLIPFSSYEGKTTFLIFAYNSQMDGRGQVSDTSFKCFHSPGHEHIYETGVVDNFLGDAS